MLVVFNDLCVGHVCRPARFADNIQIEPGNLGLLVCQKLYSKLRDIPDTYTFMLGSTVVEIHIWNRKVPWDVISASKIRQTRL